MAQPVSGLTSAGQMIEANGHLFVSSGRSGSEVTVLSPSGTTLKVISGEPGAWGMVASPDGHSVYVALSNSDAISVIDTSTLSETARYTVDSCPDSVALAAGRLFYSFDCSEESPSAGVSSIDPDSGGTPVPTVVADQVDVGLIRGSGSTLAVPAEDGFLTTYAADGTGALTQLASIQIETDPGDMAFTADGNHLLTAIGAPYQITSYNPNTLSQDMVYPGVPYPDAVASDPTGQNVAAGFDSASSTVALFGRSSGTTKWARYPTGTDPSKWRPEVGTTTQFAPQTLTFSANGSMVYGLVSGLNNSDGLHLFSSAVAPSAGPAISVKVPNVAPGKNQAATITVHGVSRAEVGLTGTSAGSSASLGTVTTNAHGVGHLPFRAPYSGTITAAYLGSATRLPSKTTTRFTVGSKTTVRFVGSYRKWHGITYFKSYKKINVIFRTTPPVQPRAVKVELFVRGNSGWRHHWHHATEGAKGLRVFFHSAPKYTEMKARVKVPGDRFSRGSTATSKIFEIA
jgi:YVTN family beta-propeller protein